MYKKDVVYMGCCLAIKKQNKTRNNAICSDEDGPRDYHTKLSKPDRERQVPYITCMWNLRNKDTNKLICKTATDPQILKAKSWLPMVKEKEE